MFSIVLALFVGAVLGWGRGLRGEGMWEWGMGGSKILSGTTLSYMKLQQIQSTALMCAKLYKITYGFAKLFRVTLNYVKLR